MKKIIVFLLLLCTVFATTHDVVLGESFRAFFADSFVVNGSSFDVVGVAIDKFDDSQSGIDVIGPNSDDSVFLSLGATVVGDYLINVTGVFKSYVTTQPGSAGIIVTEAPGTVTHDVVLGESFRAFASEPFVVNGSSFEVVGGGIVDYDDSQSNVRVRDLSSDVVYTLGLGSNVVGDYLFNVTGVFKSFVSGQGLSAGIIVTEAPGPITHDANPGESVRVKLNDRLVVSASSYKVVGLTIDESNNAQSLVTIQDELTGETYVINLVDNREIGGLSFNLTGITKSYVVGGTSADLLITIPTPEPEVVSISEVSIPFAINAWGAKGWGECTSMSGRQAKADQLCQCAGYEKAVDNNACYYEWARQRYYANSCEQGSGLVEKGKYKYAGSGVTKIKCIGSNGETSLNIQGPPVAVSSDTAKKYSLTLNRFSALPNGDQIRVIYRNGNYYLYIIKSGRMYSNKVVIGGNYNLAGYNVELINIYKSNWRTIALLSVKTATGFSLGEPMTFFEQTTDTIADLISGVLSFFEASGKELTEEQKAELTFFEPLKEA